MAVRKLPTEEVLHIRKPERKKAAETETTSLKAVYRTADVLRCLQRTPMTLSEVANELKVHKSTAHRLLQVLEDANMVIRNRLDRRFYLGSLIAELVSDPDVTHQYLVSCAVHPMKRLAEITGESIGLNILIGIHNVLLYEIPSRYDLRIAAIRKVTNELHAGAHSKILLSQLNPRDLTIVVNNLNYTPFTERTTTTKEELMAQVDRIRDQGYAMSYGEKIREAMDIDVPISNYFVPASLGILGPESRMKPRTEEYLKAILEARTEIERNISEAFD